MDGKVLITDPIEQGCIDILNGEGFLVDHKPGIPPEELKTIIGGYDALIVRSGTKVTADIIEHAGRLRIIGRAGTGVDNVDVQAATRRGILVMNVPGGNAISTAEHTIGLLLALARNIPAAVNSLREGKWDRKKFLGTELCGKTIGIVGLGKVGRQVASRCRAFEMKVIGCDPILSPDVAAKLGVELVTFDEVLERSDVISLHTPLSDETRGLISDREIARCRSGVRFVNCARGGIIDEAALLRGLESGKVAGAALDGYSKEPPPVDNPLIRHPKVVATPHLGASTGEAQEKVAIAIAHQVADVLKEQEVVGAVNLPDPLIAGRKDLLPYFKLAEKLGSLLAQLMPGPLKSLTVMTSGESLHGATNAIRIALLKGMFDRILSAPATYINAPVFAKEMGIDVSERHEARLKRPETQVSVEFTAATNERRSCAGTVFGTGDLRITKIDGFPLEIRPEGYLLIYSNVDKPGMLAAVGSVLAKAEINIAGIALGRNTPGGEALAVVSVDSEVPAGVLAEIGAISGIGKTRLVCL
ncbi:MAG: phosphoglycerate dehydrogenase [Ignavibacteriales bacterium CG07_land_8_20_14_0_80_59_12]|nr:MAG: phosphoglycerate dehydrogenase [Ignavibacteriales bacterium CG07_land_8_20_14_0_80_59_12]